MKILTFNINCERQTKDMYFDHLIVVHNDRLRPLQSKQ